MFIITTLGRFKTYLFSLNQDNSVADLKTSPPACHRLHKTHLMLQFLKRNCLEEHFHIEAWPYLIQLKSVPHLKSLQNQNYRNLQLHQNKKGSIPKVARHYHVTEKPQVELTFSSTPELLDSSNSIC